MEGFEGTDWTQGLDMAVTICDREGKKLYMKQRSHETYDKNSDIIRNYLLEYPL